MGDEHVADRAIVGEVVAAVRVAATPAALDTAVWPPDATALRLAADEVLLVDVLDVAAPEPHAIVFPDTSWVRFSFAPADGAELIARAATWPPPEAGLAQGAVAGVPVKLVVRPDGWWLIVHGVLADEFEERMHEVMS